MNPSILKGHLDGLILSVLEGEPRHGYAIIEELRGRTGGTLDLPSGTIYPALHRLQRTGHIAGEWSVVGGRRRRTYRITRTGRRLLTAQRNEWRGFAHMMERALAVQP